MKLFGRQGVLHLFQVDPDIGHAPKGSLILTCCGKWLTLSEDVHRGGAPAKGWVACTRCLAVLMNEHDRYISAVQAADAVNREQYEELVATHNELVDNYNALLRERAQ